MDIIVNFLLSQSILLPIIVSLVRIKRLEKIYYPFFIVLLLGLLAEVASFIFINVFKVSNAPVIKVYSLFECCLIIYQLYLWKNFSKNRQWFMIALVICITFWIVETIAFFNINTFSPYFRVFYAFVIVLLSINQINGMIFNHKESLFKNPRFLLSLGFIIFFLYQIIYEASYYVGSDQSVVATKIIIGFGYINFVINLLYAIAIYLITSKHEDNYNHYFNER